MKAIVTINKDLAIIAGHENFGNKEIEFNIFELSKEERKELINSKYDSKKELYEIADYTMSYADIDYEFRNQAKIGCENPGIAEIKKILQSRIDNRKKQNAYRIIKKQKKEESQKKETQEKLQKVKKMFEENDLHNLSYYFSSYEKYMTDIQKKKISNYRLEKMEIEKKAKKKEEEKKEQLEKEKKEWCKEKGSDQLYKGMKAGYNINRLYIEERAEEELSKFGTVIFDSKEEIATKSRNCPSLKRLELEEEIKKAGYKTNILWCVDNRDLYYTEEPDQFEAIHITFLEKYDIFIK